jgi:UDP-N-acetylmuramoyl-tripeptide--D-alanyl-D-alanine ligase
MSFWSHDNLCHHSGGRWLQAAVRNGRLRGVGIASRADLAKALFVAIRGENHDGHDHLREAADAGAVLLIVHELPAGGLPDNVGVILVDDTRKALGRLAAAYREQLAGAAVIAVTGSAGKTTVKMLIDRVLSTIGVITTVGRAHLQGFGSLDRVAEEKATLLRHLKSHQVRRLAVVNADVPRLRDHCCLPHTVKFFGEADDADLQLTDRGTQDGAWWLEVNRSQRFRLGLPGRHNAVNALAAVAVARRLWIDDALIDDALAGCRPVDMRLTRQHVNGVMIYNDAYNANPESVVASLETFAELAANAPRRVIVLGDMLELGDASARLHREIGRRVVEFDRWLPVDRVVLIGPNSAHTAEPIDKAWSADRLTWLPELDAAGAAAVAQMLEPNDAVLLKASRAVGLERIIRSIARAPGAEPAAEVLPQLTEP